MVHEQIEETERHGREAKVRQHYDAPPELFELFLDPDMHYSTALYADEAMDLAAAQQRKLAEYARWLKVRAGSAFLDVGCGWGPLCLYIARLGAVVTGLTLSPNQAAYTARRALAAGLGDRVQALVRPLLEYPLAAESLDGVSFIGSIVHMREREEVMRRVAGALRPGGRLVVSETYRPDSRRTGFDTRGSHFITTETFGFSHVTVLSAEIAAMEEAGFRVLHVEDSTDDYVRTLTAWIERLRANRRQVEAFGSDTYKNLRKYMEVGRASMRQRITLQYEIVAERLASDRTPSPSAG